MSFSEYITENTEMLQELKISPTSEIYKGLVSFYKTGKEIASDMSNFIRYDLVDKLKRVTNKGLFLLFGGDVDLTSTAKSFSYEMVKKQAQLAKDRLQAKLDADIIKTAWVVADSKGVHGNAQVNNYEKGKFRPNARLN
jgi:hypothetical protein